MDTVRLHHHADSRDMRHYRGTSESVRTCQSTQTVHEEDKETAFGRDYFFLRLYFFGFQKI